jgi:membrane-associated phospholipid phosphatase
MHPCLIFLPFDNEIYYGDYYYQKYVNENEVCTNEEPYLLQEARLSFMSGHASFSFYCATFLFIYMNTQTKQLKWGSKIVHWIQILLFVLATSISFTRISDHYHFPLDILCGALTGVGFGLYFSESKRPTGETMQSIPLNDVQYRRKVCGGEPQEPQFMQSIPLQ